MLCVRFCHIVAMFFVWICLLHFLDIIISMGRVYTLFDARIQDLTPSVSSCTLLNCVTINIVAGYLHTITDLFCFSNYTVALFIYKDSGYTAILSYTIVCTPLIVPPLDTLVLLP